MRVAAVQFAPAFKNAAANRLVMEGMVREAAMGGAELIVLPELSTTGYSFMSSDDARPYAEQLEGPTFQLMSRLSEALQVAIAYGFMEVDPDGRLFNSQCLIAPGSGVDHFLLRKRNLWGNDFLWATRGDESPLIVDWRGQKIGMLICRDIRNKNEEDGDYYEKGDATIIAFSSNFGRGGFPSVTWMDFAKDNDVNLVASNRYGEEEHNDFGPGGICVIRPSGKVECQGLKWSRPCVVYADV